MPAPDLNTRAILWTGIAIALTVSGVVAAVLLLLQHWQLPGGGERVPLGYGLVIEGPALQSSPQADLARYRAEKKKQLESVGWVNASQGIVRIPIADAMGMLAQGAARAASASSAATAPKESR
jgi:hypothetical protein